MLHARVILIHFATCKTTRHQDLIKANTFFSAGPDKTTVKANQQKIIKMQI